MEFPKKVMTTPELCEFMGMSRWRLSKYAHVEGQTYATRAPGGRNYIWDTEKFGKALAKRAVR